MNQLPQIAGRQPTIYRSIVTSRFYALDDDSDAILGPDGKWNPCDESRQGERGRFPGCYRDEFTFPTEADAREFAIEVAGREGAVSSKCNCELCVMPQNEFDDLCRRMRSSLKPPTPTLAEPGAKAGCEEQSRLASLYEVRCFLGAVDTALQMAAVGKLDSLSAVKFSRRAKELFPTVMTDEEAATVRGTISRKGES